MKRVLACALALMWLTPAVCGAEKKKGGKKKGESPEAAMAQRIERVRQRLTEVSVNDAAARNLESTARQFLADAERELAAGRVSSAQGFSQAAEALTRAVDHIRHSRETSPKGYPSREAQAERLERAYFRLQQAEYFQTQSKDPRAKGLAQAGRQFYQKARRAYDRKEARDADEFAKVCEEIVRALEYLARTAAPAREPPRLK
jgi:hypothetical protein